ncbi:protein kinase domain-containing protein [Nocardia pseudobrasiliensis]|uniref:Serine/threonine protein kinase n=1 Tax=Nocardia pseudobrasiliensis TaxID=45979 RepID=A0A370I9H3_9NOCA|nr:protein kinase [Nocardia pseudobrasiliensis]RDI66054.1 serine/threonine protein kinase [Nocardia pseudobrasiliensis]
MNTASAATIARFAADWQTALREGRLEPPRLAHYLPDGVEMRLAVLAELVRIDQRERRRRRAASRRMSEYGKEFPDLLGSERFVELVCEEYALRRRYEAIGLAEFCTEYPEQADELRRRYLDSEQPRRTGGVPGLPDRIEIGIRLDDFDLLTELGGRAHAKVFLARQLSMQRLVAVRVEAGDEHDPHRVAQLDHQYIVRVFDQRVVVEPGGATLRLQYMQYLPGGTGDELLSALGSATPDGGRALLRSVDAAMEARGEIRPTDSSVRREIAALSWPETVAWIGRRLATALDYADHQDISHGAVKPANVLFTAEGVPKLADFGCDPPLDIDPEATPYQAPEHLAALIDPDAPVPDTRADLYALGVLLWEMLTGARPFDEHEGDSAAPLAAMRRDRHAGIGPHALDRLPADTPATLRRVLLRCLEPDPSRRWQSGSELAGQLELCLDERARDLVDPPPDSWRHRARRWPLIIAALCVGVPNLLASLYNIRLNQILIVDGLDAADQQRFQTVAVINNAIAFPLATVVMVLLCRRALTAARRLARGRGYPPEELARARRETLSIGDRLVWVPFVMWLVAGAAWPLGLMSTGVALPSRNFVQFYTAQVVCAAIALAYPFFLATVFAVRSLYPQLLVAGPVGTEDGRQLARLARRGSGYLAAAASVPLLAVATATFVPDGQLALVIGPVRTLSVGGILAFVLTYWLFRLLEADLRALIRAVPRGVR